MRAAGEFLEIITFLKEKLMFLMQGESSHACNRTLHSCMCIANYTHVVKPYGFIGPRAMACSFAHTKTRLEATLPFRTLEMQLQFSLHAGLFTSGGMLPSAKAHAYARPIHAHFHYPV